MDTRPIGVFDSGIGGLTVMREIASRLPHEDLLYLGDTARVPYGIKSAATIVRYSLQNARFLLARDIKLLVVACNSASSVALPELQRRLSVPVVGVIEPGARRAARETRSQVVGVIGTAATIASGAYERALARCASGLRVISRACPLFVPLVEEGWVDNEICRLTARTYLKDLPGLGVDTLVLGCTHYPLLKQVISRIVGEGVRLVDSAREVAWVVGELMEENGLGGRQEGPPGRCAYFVTDAAEGFRRVGERFLGEPIGDLTLVDITEGGEPGGHAAAVAPAAKA